MEIFPWSGYRRRNSVVIRIVLQDKLVEEIFSHEDKDKDGVISHDEFSGPKHDEL